MLLARRQETHNLALEYVSNYNVQKVMQKKPFHINSLTRNREKCDSSKSKWQKNQNANYALQKFLVQTNVVRVSFIRVPNSPTKWCTWQNQH